MVHESQDDEKEVRTGALEDMPENVKAPEKEPKVETEDQ